MTLLEFKKWKHTNKLCVHPHIFCRCAILFLKQQNQCDRPFPPDSVLDRIDNKFLQVSDKSEELLTNTGLKIASILCADISARPSLPKILGNFTISKIFFNSYWCYVLHSHQIRQGPALKPSHHVICQVIGNSPLLQLIIRNSHRLISCNNGIQKYVNHI